MATETEAFEGKGKKRGAKRAGQARGKAKAAAAAKGGEAMTLADKRAGKRKRLAEANTITMILETPVRQFVAAQAKAAGMDIAPFLMKIVENHVVETAPDGDPLAARLAAKRAVLGRAVDYARELDEAGGFDDHFILNVLKKAAADPQFVADYNAALDGEGKDDKALARAKAPIHQQMGRLIKRAAGAKSKRDENGKILRGQVQGEMISAYTLLEKA